MKKRDFRRFVPLAKIDEERRELHGFLAIEEGDHADEILDYAKSKPHFAKWSEGVKKATAGKSEGNLRVMHGDKVAGIFSSVGFDDEARGFPVVAKIIDDAEWKMTLAGGYTGFSIGGSYGKRWEDPDDSSLTRYEAIPVEGSLVDSPCIPGATFEVLRANGATELRKFTTADFEPNLIPRTCLDVTKHVITPEQAAAIFKGISKFEAAYPGALHKMLSATPGQEYTPADLLLTKEVHSGAEVVSVANEAIGSLKELVAGVATMPGEPDTFALDGVLDAVRGAISGKIAGETAAEAEGLPSPEAGPDTPVGDGEAAEDDEEDDDDETPVIEEMADDDDEDEPLTNAARSGDMKKITKLLKAGFRVKLTDAGDLEVLKAMDEDEEDSTEEAEAEGDGDGDSDETSSDDGEAGDGESEEAAADDDEDEEPDAEKVKRGELAKVVAQVSKRLTKAMTKAMQPLTKKLAGIEVRLETVEKRPAEVGTPATAVGKHLGSQVDGAVGQGVDNIEALITATKALPGGLDKAAESNLRLGAVAAMLKGSR